MGGRHAFACQSCGEPKETPFGITIGEGPFARLCKECRHGKIDPRTTAPVNKISAIEPTLVALMQDDMGVVTEVHPLFTIRKPAVLAQFPRVARILFPDEFGRE